MRNAAEFDRLADAVLYQSRTTMRPRGLNAEIEREHEGNEDEGNDAMVADADLGPATVPYMPAARRARGGTPGTRRRAPPAPPAERERDGATASAVLIPAFMVLRSGATTPRGLGPCVSLFALIAVTVALLAIAGLAIAAPDDDWAVAVPGLTRS